MTLTAWLLVWVEKHGAAWQPRTRRDRARYADRWIVPRIGAMRLQEIGRLYIRDWRADVVKQTTPYVANAAVRVLSAALGAAVEDGVALANPCQGLRRLPGEAVNRRTPATLIEVETIRAHL